MKIIKLCLFSSIAIICLGISSVFAMDKNERKEYLQWMQENMPEVEEFTTWQESSGELPPDFDQFPKNNLLPDPFVFLNGDPVGNSTQDWEKRREEIMDLFEKYVTGTFPEKPEISRVETLDETESGSYTVRNVKLWFGPNDAASVRVRVVIPNTGTKGEKYPVLLTPSLSGWGNTVLRRGYISAGYAGSDFMDDSAQLIELYPDYDFAKLPRRAWLAQIVLDYLETLPEVNKEQIAMFGYSRDGKMALIAAALDERISVLIAGSTGVGGVVPWRLSGERGGGESIETTTRMFPDWFVPRFRYFSGHEDRLPVDANLLLALVAPRAVLMEWGYNDEVANGWAMEQAYKSTLKVYERFGKPENLQLMCVPGFHGSNDQDACVDFMDIHFGKSNKKWNYEFVFPWNFEKWQAMSGERLEMNGLSKYNDNIPIATSLEQWTKKSKEIRKSMNDMLGEAPAILPTEKNNNSFRWNLNRPGPTEIAKGNIGNPGQLSPDVAAWVISRGGKEFGWLEPEKNEVTSRRVTFGPDNITGDLFYPINTPDDAKLPVVIWLHGHHFPLGYMWVYRQDLHPILALVKAGFAVLAYDQTGYGTRTDESAPFYDRYPHWSRFGKMVEDVSNAVTMLQNENMIDGENISVLGFSLGGSVGLYAAAMDERIKQVVSVCGFTPMRTDKTENGLSGITRYSHLYGLIPRLGLFAEQQDLLPYDYDDVIALVSPRPVLIVQNSMDRDADPQMVRKAVERAQEIYELNNAKEKLTLKEPYDYGRMTAKTQNEIIEWLKQYCTTKKQ